MTSREERLERALRGILEIGKRDMSNPKYDGYFNEAREALAAPDEPPAPAPQPAEVKNAMTELRKTCDEVDHSDLVCVAKRNIQTLLHALSQQALAPKVISEAQEKSLRFELAEMIMTSPFEYSGNPHTLRRSIASMVAMWSGEFWALHPHLREEPSR